MEGQVICIIGYINLYSVLLYTECFRKCVVYAYKFLHTKNSMNLTNITVKTAEFTSCSAAWLSMKTAEIVQIKHLCLQLIREKENSYDFFSLVQCY